MSFFIKHSHKLQNGSGKYKPLKNKYKKEPPIPNKKRKTKASAVSDDEISSSDDEELRKPTPETVSSSEDERETAQEKNLRLAKKYLKKVEDEEHQDTPNNIDGVARRLKQDYLQQVGRLRISVATKCTDTNLNDEAVTLKAKEHRSAITYLCLAADNSHFFSGSKDGCIVKWCVETKKKIAVVSYSKRKRDDAEDTIPFVGHSAGISALAISGNGNFLCSSDFNSKFIRVWTNATASLTYLHTFRGHQKPITALSCRGADLYSGSVDRTIRAWRLAPDLTYLETVFGHQDSVASLSVPISAEGIIVSAGGRDGTLRLWKLAEESQLVFGEGGIGSEGKASIDVVRFITQDMFVSGADNGDICVWSVRRKKPLCFARAAHGLDPTNGQPHWITSLATVPNGDLIISGSNNGAIKLWHLSASNRSLGLLREIPVVGFVNSLELTKDGKSLIAAIGTEHKLGRWTVLKQAKNSIQIIPLYKQ